MSKVDSIIEEAKKRAAQMKPHGEDDSSSTASCENKAGLDFVKRLILVISIAALALSVIPPFAISGFVLGAGVLAFCWYANKKEIIPYQKAAIFLGACALFLGLVVACISTNSAANDRVQLAQTGQELAVLQEKVTAQEAELAKEDPVLSLSIAGGGATGVKSVLVAVTGTTSTGVAVNDTRTIVVGGNNILGYPPGEYQFAVAAFTAPDGKTIYKESRASCSYDGAVAKSVPLQLIQNTEEMQRIAAEEEAARQAAEAAKAEEEATAKAKAAEEAQNSVSNEYTVYITNTGKKYHAGGCQYLKKSKIAISESDAQAQGYTPCSRCNP